MGVSMEPEERLEPADSIGPRLKAYGTGRTFPAFPQNTPAELQGGV